MPWTGVITNAGKALLEQWAGGGSLSITSAAAGSGTVAEAALLAQTALVSQKQTASIVSGTQTDEGYRIKLQLTAPDMGYTLNQYGLWASLNGGTSVLFALFQRTDGVVIPAKSEMPDFVYALYGILSISNTGSFSVVVDTSALVTRATMEDYVDAATAAVQESLDEHIDDTSIHITATERTAWNSKVDSEAGKGLSTNDYTSAEKTKLAGVATGATANTGTITEVQANGTSVATSGVANIPAASTSVYGVTRLTNSTVSTSTSSAASAYAVKFAYDLASTRTNPNLLDNAWFIVNQKGESSYAATQYGPDRWKVTSGTIACSSDGVTRSSGTLTARQLMNAANRNTLIGKQLTCSMLLSTGTIKSYTATMTATMTFRVNTSGTVTTTTVTSGYENEVCQIYGTATNIIRAVKLEVGSVSTLAYDVMPEYTTELINCQRYYQISTDIFVAVGASSTDIVPGVLFPVPMVSKPTVTIYSNYPSNANTVATWGSLGFATVSSASCDKQGIYYIRTTASKTWTNGIAHYYYVADANL